jgi:hypothetical protein
VNRLGLAELGELFNGQTLEIQGRVEEVEVGRNGTGTARGHQQALLNCNVF